MHLQKGVFATPAASNGRIAGVATSTCSLMMKILEAREKSMCAVPTSEPTKPLIAIRSISDRHGEPPTHAQEEINWQRFVMSSVMTAIIAIRCAWRAEDIAKCVSTCVGTTIFTAQSASLGHAGLVIPMNRRNTGGLRTRNEAMDAQSHSH